MPLILSTMFLMFASSSASIVALNLALQFGHSNIPMRLWGSSGFVGFRTENGHVLIGVVTSVPHLGHFGMDMLLLSLGIIVFCEFKNCG